MRDDDDVSKPESAESKKKKKRPRWDARTRRKIANKYAMMMAKPRRYRQFKVKSYISEQ